MKIKLTRFFDDGQTTLGTLFVKNTRYYTCELSWKNNKEFISCIPTGIYDVELYTTNSKSKFYKKALLIKNVPNRSNILLHIANTHLDIEGCIGAGKDVDPNIYNKKSNEYNLGVINSGEAIREILKLHEEIKQIEIIDNIKSYL